MPSDRELDEQLLSHATYEWRKVARVIGTALTARRADLVDDTYLAGRIAELVRRGSLEARGNPAEIHYAEVRLPAAVA